MDVLEIRSRGAASVGQARQPKRLMLIYSGATVLLQACLVLINYFLNEGIAATGGLAGMGMRSVLTTAQTMLQILATVLLPFWQMGLSGVCLMIARREYAEPKDLLCGFRRFGPVLGLQLWRFFLLFAVMMVCSQVASALFMMTPLSRDFEAAMMPYMASGVVDYEAMLQADPQELLEAMKPMLYFFAALAIPATAFALYLTRFAKYGVMDRSDMRPLRAMIHSLKFSVRNFGKLLRLDLSFWWYYLLQVLLLILGYGDLLVGKFVALDSNLLFYAAFAVQAVATVAVAVTAQLPVEVTYATAYEESTT